VSVVLVAKQQPQSVGVGETQLGAGVRPFLANDQPHPLRPALEDVAVEFADPGAVADLVLQPRFSIFPGQRPCSECS
jgi:hypothetical protein